MLKTLYLNNSVFHGYFITVELSMFITMEGLVEHIRERLKALCTMNNLLHLRDKASNLQIKPEIYSTIEDMMLSNEPMLRLMCRDVADEKCSLQGNMLISENVNY